MAELDDAVAIAQGAVTHLWGVMVAHGMETTDLCLVLGPLLELGWPQPVREAYDEWAFLMNDVTKALAFEEEGIKPGAILDDMQRVRFTVRAFVLVMSFR